MSSYPFHSAMVYGNGSSKVSGMCYRSLRSQLARLTYSPLIHLSVGYFLPFSISGLHRIHVESPSSAVDHTPTQIRFHTSISEAEQAPRPPKYLICVGAYNDTQANRTHSSIQPRIPRQREKHRARSLIFKTSTCSSRSSRHQTS